MPYTPQELTAVLQKYKAGKQSLERRVIAAENWWKLRNRFEEDKRPGAASSGDFRAVSGWLHNVIVSKHADAMEAYPEPVILPREPDDRAEAELLSAVVPCILEQNAFERTWSDAMWQKLKTGTAAYRVGWDPDKLGGLGDISIERVDLLNLFWEPGIADIQRSKFVFCTHLEDNDELEEEFPQLRGRLRGNPFTATRFLYDDAVSLDGKSTVVEAYYRRKRAGRMVLHYVKYVGDTVLYSTEEGDSAEDGSTPPLCKGRWVGASRAGGIVQQPAGQAPISGESASNPAADNPSVAPRQLPLHKGAKGDLTPAVSFPNGQSLTPPQRDGSTPPLCKGRWIGASRAGGIVQQPAGQAPISGESASNPAADNPSVASRQLPLHKGAKSDLNPAWSFPNWHSLNTGDPSVSFADSVSLRLGHGAALTCPRHVIHARAAASLPRRGAKDASTPAPDGLYAHGRYPFVLDPLFPVEGSPCGYGFVDLCHNNQTAIDLMRSAIIKNTVVGATPRYFQRIDGSVNEEEFADLGRALVHVSGNLGEDSLRQIGFSPLSGVYMDVLNSSIQELRETSGNTETSTGNISSGVTAASAIAALQEASGKGSRDSTRSSYIAYAQIVELCIELIRQFYGLPRSFRIAGRAGAEEYIRFSNAGLCPRPQPFGAALPVFDVKVSAQKRNAYSRLSQNELAMELYRMGIFDEGKEQEALSCLRMMEFDGRDELIGRITASMGLREKLDELQKYKALALAFARRYRPDMAEGLGVAVDPSLGSPLRGAVASATEGSPELSPEQSEKDTALAALAALLPPPYLP